MAQGYGKQKDGKAQRDQSRVEKCIYSARGPAWRRQRKKKREKEEI